MTSIKSVIRGFSLYHLCNIFFYKHNFFHWVFFFFITSSYNPERISLVWFLLVIFLSNPGLKAVVEARPGTINSVKCLESLWHERAVALNAHRQQLYYTHTQCCVWLCIIHQALKPNLLSCWMFTHFIPSSSPCYANTHSYTTHICLQNVTHTHTPLPPPGF